MNLLLSIDGGGALGIGPATLLANMERETKIPAKAYSGTSVGALLVALAANGMSWDEIMLIFRKECPRIFSPAPWAWRLNPGRPRYDGTALREAARRYFGDMRMDKLCYPTFITAFDFQKGRPKIFDTSEGTLVRDAIVASASAPTYFPIAEGGHYGDGGLIANNPSMIGIAGCISKLGWNLNQIQCLSLGTNGDKWDDPKVGGMMLELQWVKPLIETMLTGNEELATFQAQAILGAAYLRIEPVLLKTIEMDDITATSYYQSIWTGLWKMRRDEVLQWLRVGAEA